MNEKPKHDLEGKEFNFLKVKKAVRKRTCHGNFWQWECECICGKLVIKTASKLLKGIATSCGCSKLNTGKKNNRFNGCENLTGDFVSKFRMNAKYRQIEFTIDSNYLWELWIKCGGKCSLTGELLYLPKTSRERRSGDYTASIDRIDNTKGYIEGNVQWVHKDVNRLKWDLTEEKLIYLCEKIVSWKLQKNF